MAETADPVPTLPSILLHCLLGRFPDFFLQLQHLSCVVEGVLGSHCNSASPLGPTYPRRALLFDLCQFT